MANSKTKKRRRYIILSLIVLLLAGASAVGFFWKRDLPINIQVEKVQRRDLTELVVANGKIQPFLQVKISPEVSGEIIELPVKEGQKIKKGDLLLRIKPDYYTANRRSAEANLKATTASKNLVQANLEKAGIEFKRYQELLQKQLVSESQFLEAKTTFDVAQAQHKNATHLEEVARATLARAEEEMSKTSIYSPITGTVSKLNSELGERVVGTATMAGTDVMTLADLNDMEARVDIGEIDVVLIAIGQQAELEVDAFKNRKFHGTVTEIANTAKATGQGTQQEATKFEVRIRVQEKEIFRPGMSVTAEIQTRSRTNVLSVPIQSVTTRMPKPPPGKKGSAQSAAEDKPPEKKDKPGNKKQEEAKKPAEVVFVRDGEKVRMTKVKRGISNDNYVEILEGLREAEEVVSGGYKAINRELEDGKKIKVGKANTDVIPEKK